MTLAELAEASGKAGNALRAYRETWGAWRKQVKGEITAYQVAIGKDIKRLEKFRDTLKEIAQQIADMDRLVDAMKEPPLLPAEIGAKVTCELTGDVIGMPPELRPIAAALSMFVQPPRVCGIYFLVRGATVVYVGQSVNIAGRVAGHVNTGKEWDRTFFLEMERKQLDSMELAFIRMLKPEYNRAGMDVATEEDKEVVDQLITRCRGPLTAAAPPEEPEGPDAGGPATMEAKAETA